MHGSSRRRAVSGLEGLAQGSTPGGAEGLEKACQEKGEGEELVYSAHGSGGEEGRGEVLRICPRVMDEAVIG